MTFTHFISEHGYWMLAAGALLEGETALVMAGFAAHRGLLDLRWVMLIAGCAGWTSDQLLFWLGRRHGADVFARWPRLAAHAGQARAWIERRPSGAIIGVRFAYGMRVAGPILIGMSSVSAWRYIGLNAIGAALWAVLLSMAGWFFGEAAQRLLGRIAHLEGVLLLVLAAGGFGWWVLRRVRERRQR